MQEHDHLACLGSGLSPEEEKRQRYEVRAEERGEVYAEGWSADYAGATVRDIPSTAWSYANREHDLDINRVVIHYTAGMSFGPIAFGPGGLAHYGVSQDGRVDQYISERYIAWHAANWDWNQHSIGIEHVGFGRPQDWTDAMLNASAKLTADICRRRGVPIDRTHIKGHSEIPGATHTDVGPNFPWSRYIDLVKKYAGGSSPAPKPEPGGDVWHRLKVPAQQQGAYRDKKNAEDYQAKLKALGVKSSIETGK